MPASELLEWIEYDRCEPFGDWRSDWRNAQVAHILANAFRAENTGPVPFSRFIWRDPRDVQDENDAAMIAFMDSKVVTDGN